MDLLNKGAIGVARSLIPGSLCAVDKTMEETFMKFAKSSGKIFTNNPFCIEKYVSIKLTKNGKTNKERIEQRP